MVFLIETKIKLWNVLKLKQKIDLPNMVAMDCEGKSRGLALFCSQEVLIKVLSYSKGHIDAIMKGEDSLQGWFLASFSNNPSVERRKDSWTLLERLSHGRTDPWLNIRDFNEILLWQEKSGRIDRSPWQIQKFREDMVLVGLHDLGCKGCAFTWFNGRK